MAFAVLRFNFASPGGVPAVQGELLSAALKLQPPWRGDTGVVSAEYYTELCREAGL
jgi:hypothetical protein